MDFLSVHAAEYVPLKKSPIVDQSQASMLSAHTAAHIPPQSHLLSVEAAVYTPKYPSPSGLSGQAAEYVPKGSAGASRAKQEPTQLSVEAAEYVPSYCHASVGPVVYCSFFARGACRKGGACPFSHAERLEKFNGRTIGDAEGLDTLSVCLEGTTECIFGKGAVVTSVSTGQALGISRVCINGLASFVTDEDVQDMVSAFGPPGCVLRLVRRHETYAFATFAEPSQAISAVAELHGSKLNRWSVLKAPDTASPKASSSDGLVTVRLAAEPGSVTMGATSVKVSWFAPTRVGWVHFSSLGGAKAAAKACNQQLFDGRSITAKLQQPTRNQRESFSIVLEGLSDCSTEKNVQDWVEHICHGPNPTSATLQPTPFLSSNAPNIIKRVLSKHGDLEIFEVAPQNGGSLLKCKAQAKFLTSRDAAAAVRALHAMPVRELGGYKLFLARVFSAKFVVLNSVLAVVSKEMSALVATAEKEGAVRLHSVSGDQVSSIRVTASDFNTLTIVKGKLQLLFAGERLLVSPPRMLQHDEGALGPRESTRTPAVWHASFTNKHARQALEEMGAQSGALVVCDARRRELLLYGSRDARVAAATAVLAHLDLLSRQLHTLPVPAITWRPLVAQGLTSLMDMLGARHVHFDIANRALVVEGSERSAELACDHVALLALKAQQMAKDRLGRLINTGAAAEEVCPLCLCGAEEGEDTVQLSCTHRYCRSCFDAYVAQSCSGDSSCGRHFPFKCFADGCNKPIPVRELRVLVASEEVFTTLLRASLDEHIQANLETLQFCITPNCRNIYALDKDRVVRCSSCAVDICTNCRHEEHEGLSCREQADQRTPGNRIRNRLNEEILTLACPRCSKAFLDFEGCFAIKCSACPCNFCGWCLQDCGTDAHEHVRACRDSLTPGSYFATAADFKTAHKKRRALRLANFVAALAPEELASIATDLEQLALEDAAAL